jgi:hypothetical protein
VDWGSLPSTLPHCLPRIKNSALEIHSYQDAHLILKGSEAQDSRCGQDSPCKKRGGWERKASWADLRIWEVFMVS